MADRKVVGRLKGARDPVSIEWEIADFQSLPAEVDVRHESPTFYFCNEPWYLQLFPNGLKCYSSEGYIGLYLVKVQSGYPVHVRINLFLKKTDGRKVVLVEEAKHTFRGRLDWWGKAKAIGRSELLDQKSVFFPTGVLTLICTLRCDETIGVGDGTGRDVALQTTESFGKDVALQTTERFGKDVALQTTACIGKDVAVQTTVRGATYYKALCDFEKMLLDKDVCDVTFQVKEQRFEAHRTILRARSSVFASMLSIDMKEKNTGVVDIEDCEPEHFLDFLRFLYCGTTDTISTQNAYSLYRAGDKYDVQDLKSECLAFIKSHLDVDNFCDTITLALQYGETDLIKQATDFFAKNMLKIIVTVKWQVFVTENPIQGNELTIKALSAQKSLNS